MRNVSYKKIPTKAALKLKKILETPEETSDYSLMRGIQKNRRKNAVQKALENLRSALSIANRGYLSQVENYYLKWLEEEISKSQYKIESDSSLEKALDTVDPLQFLKDQLFLLSQAEDFKDREANAKIQQLRDLLPALKHALRHQRDGLTFNPFHESKQLSRLGESFIKALETELEKNPEEKDAAQNWNRIKSILSNQKRLTEEKGEEEKSGFHQEINQHHSEIFTAISQVAFFYHQFNDYKQEQQKTAELALTTDSSISVAERFCKDAERQFNLKGYFYFSGTPSNLPPAIFQTLITIIEKLYFSSGNTDKLASFLIEGSEKPVISEKLAEFLEQIQKDFIEAHSKELEAIDVLEEKFVTQLYQKFIQDTGKQDLIKAEAFTNYCSKRINGLGKDEKAEEDEITQQLRQQLGEIEFSQLNHELQFNPEFRKQRSDIKKQIKTLKKLIKQLVVFAGGHSIIEKDTSPKTSLTENVDFSREKKREKPKKVLYKVSEKKPRLLIENLLTEAKKQQKRHLNNKSQHPFKEAAQKLWEVVTDSLNNKDQKEVKNEKEIIKQARKDFEKELEKFNHGYLSSVDHFFLDSIDLDIENIQSQDESSVNKGLQALRLKLSLDSGDFPSAEFSLKNRIRLIFQEENSQNPDSVINEFKTLVPHLKAAMRLGKDEGLFYRFLGFFDAVPSSYCPELWQIYLDQIDNVLNSDKENQIKYQQLRCFFKTGSFEAEDVWLEKSNHYSNFAANIRQLVKFYQDAPRQEEDKEDNEDIDLSEVRFIDQGTFYYDRTEQETTIREKIPENTFLELNKIIERFWLIDKDLVHCLPPFSEDQTQESWVKAVICFFQDAVVKGVSRVQEQKEGAPAEELRITALQEHYFEKEIASAEQNYLKILHEKLAKASDREKFDQLCYTILYPEKNQDRSEIEAEFKNSLDLTGSAVSEVIYDLEFWINKELPALKNRLVREMNLLAVMIDSLGLQYGLARKIQKRSPLEVEEETSQNLRDHSFLHRPYFISDLDNNSDDHWFFEQTIISSKQQQAAYLKYRNRLIAAVSSRSFAFGESSPAGVATASVLTKLHQPIPLVEGFGTFGGFCSYYSNQVIVEDDIATTLDTLLSFNTLFIDNNGNEVSTFQKGLICTLGVPLTVSSGVCYGSVSGGLLFHSIFMPIFSFIGLVASSYASAFVFALLFAAFPAVTTALAIMALLYVTVADLIINWERSVLYRYFKERFYWPSLEGLSTGKALWKGFKTVCYWVFSAVKLILVFALTAVIAVVSLKLFRGKVLDLFDSLLNDKWMPTIAGEVISSLNTTLWAYFNLGKSNTLVDFFHPLNLLIKAPLILLEVFVLRIWAVIPAILSYPFTFIPAVNAWHEKFCEWATPSWVHNLFGSEKTYSNGDKEQSKPINLVGGSLKVLGGLTKGALYAVPLLGIALPLYVGYKIYRGLYRTVFSVRKCFNPKLKPSRPYSFTQFPVTHFFLKSGQAIGKALTSFGQKVSHCFGESASKKDNKNSSSQASNQGSTPTLDPTPKLGAAERATGIVNGLEQGAFFGMPGGPVLQAATKIPVSGGTGLVAVAQGGDSSIITKNAIQNSQTNRHVTGAKIVNFYDLQGKPVKRNYSMPGLGLHRLPPGERREVIGSSSRVEPQQDISQSLGVV